MRSVRTARLRTTCAIAIPLLRTLGTSIGSCSRCVSCAALGASSSVTSWRHIPGETNRNPADLFTKILTKQPFEKHRKFVLNLAGDTGMEHARRVRLATADASSSREGTGAP